jgi:hypothetical protein
VREGLLRRRPRSGRRLGFRRLPVVRQQFVDSRGRMRLHAEQHIGEVGDRVQAVHVARRYERVEAGQVLAGLVGADDEEVLAPEGGDALRALRGVLPRLCLCRARGRERTFARPAATGRGWATRHNRGGLSASAGRPTTEETRWNSQMLARAIRRLRGPATTWSSLASLVGDELRSSAPGPGRSLVLRRERRSIKRPGQPRQTSIPGRLPSGGV